MPAPAPLAPPRIRRLNVNLTAGASDELDSLAATVGSTKTDLVKWALGLIRLVIQERARGNRVAILSEDGEVLKEVVLPL